MTLTTGVYRLGPFNLAAMDQPGWENEAVQGNVPRPPGNVGIKTMRFDLVDANGNPIPRMDAHLHHVLLMNAAHTSPICPGEEERFAGSGAERTPIDLWSSYAYRTNSTDRWDALWHIMNMSDSPRTVYIQYTVGYVAASDPAASRPVTPFFMDVTGCGTNAQFNVPGTGGPGSIYTRTRSITAPWTGVAVDIGGHLHAGGIDVSIKRSSTGTVGCTAVAKYDTPEPMDFPSSISSCVLHDSVNANESYTLTARYDNSMPHSGVMGIMLAYVWHGTPPS
ncbi:MAG: hypothetical protein M3Q30_01780 [Actinomycetota bacterium]|nr:hypothetical protein [Actinomycetota bacterium]